MLFVQSRMVTQPSQCCLSIRQAQLPGSWPNLIQGTKVLIVPVPSAKVLTLESIGVVSATGLMDGRVPLVLACQHAASQGAKGIEGDAVVSKAREELWLHGALESMVTALVDIWLLPAVAFAQLLREQRAKSQLGGTICRRRMQNVP